MMNDELTADGLTEDEIFVARLTRYQSRLYAFVYTVVANRELADDIFQETNLVLWRKASKYDVSREFLPWAFAIARNQVRAAWQTKKRSRLVFDPDVADKIAESLLSRQEKVGNRQAALADCLETLPDEQRQMIRERYEEEASVADLASSRRQTANAVAVTLHRIRQSLNHCMESRLWGATT